MKFLFDRLVNVNASCWSEYDWGVVVDLIIGYEIFFAYFYDL
jgi:hypothetical protein